MADARLLRLFEMADRLSVLDRRLPGAEECAALDPMIEAFAGLAADLAEGWQTALAYALDANSPAARAEERVRYREEMTL